MLVKVTRPYSGQEGRRVKPGTIFSVGEVAEGFVAITVARCNQLKQMRLVEELEPGANATPAAPNANPRSRQGPKPANKMEPDSRTPPVRKPTQRATARRKAQEDTPGEPRPLSRRRGSPAGVQEQPASLSPVDRVSGSVTLKQRGTRRASSGSPSTTQDSPEKTPSEPESQPDAAPGQTSFTPATPDGGTASDPSPEPAAFD